MENQDQQYGFNTYSVSLNELNSDMKQNLTPTDSRLRPDQRLLENGKLDLAEREKDRLEVKQRESKSKREGDWNPLYFKEQTETDIQGKETKVFKPLNTYWKKRIDKDWSDCLNLF